MKLSEKIKQYRKEKNLSQRQFAIKSELSNGYISMLEEGKNPKTNEPIIPTLATLKKIAGAMEISISELINETEDMQISLNDEIPNIRPVTTKRFPLLGEIACGEPIYAEEDHTSYIDASADIRADFCLTAKGDSMIGARIHNGDIVFIRKQPTVNNGEIAAVVIDNEATLKRWYYYPDQKKLILNPENPAFAPLVYIGEELDGVLCLGKAICFMSNL